MEETTQAISEKKTNKKTVLRKPFDLVAEILREIRFLDENIGKRHNEKLLIWIPPGLYRREVKHQLIAEICYLDLRYATKRLRFTVHIAQRTSLRKVRISRINFDAEKNYTHFIITNDLKLTCEDLRRLIRNVTDYFEPLELRLRTHETDNEIPPDFTSDEF